MRTFKLRYPVSIILASAYSEYHAKLTNYCKWLTYTPPTSIDDKEVIKHYVDWANPLIKEYPHSARELNRCWDKHQSLSRLKAEVTELLEDFDQRCALTE